MRAVFTADQRNTAHTPKHVARAKKGNDSAIENDSSFQYDKVWISEKIREM